MKEERLQLFFLFSSANLFYFSKIKKLFFLDGSWEKSKIREKVGSFGRELATHFRNFLVGGGLVKLWVQTDCWGEWFLVASFVIWKRFELFSTVICLLLPLLELIESMLNDCFLLLYLKIMFFKIVNVCENDKSIEMINKNTYFSVWVYFFKERSEFLILTLQDWLMYCLKLIIRDKILQNEQWIDQANHFTNNWGVYCSTVLNLFIPI